MKMSLEQFKRSFAFKGRSYSFIDCVVRNKNIFCFIASRTLTDDDLYNYRKNGWSTSYRGQLLVTYVRNKESGTDWGWNTIPYDYNDTGMHCSPMVLGSTDRPKNRVIAIEMLSGNALVNRVFVSGNGPAYEDTSLISHRNGGFKRGAILKIKSINGYAYVCTGGRGFAKHLENGEWLNLSKELKAEDHDGFDDFDAFSENDIYAGGGKGDVWHYDGEKWKRIPLPTNESVKAICCGEDGYVYISCYEGLTFRGRDNKWQKIHHGGINLGFRDMVWFEGKVWCTSDYGVWTIENGVVKSANLPEGMSAYSGHLSVKDGVLLMAGLAGAAFCENGKWEVIINFYHMKNLLEEAEAKNQSE